MMLKPILRSYFLVSVALLVYFTWPQWFSGRTAQGATPKRRPLDFLTPKPRLARPPGIAPNGKDEDQEDEVKWSGAELEASLSSVVSAAAAVHSGEGDFVYLTLINAAYEALTDNWLCNVSLFPDVLRRTLIVCTHTRACQSLQKKWPAVKTLSIQPKKRRGPPGKRSRRSLNSALRWGDDNYVSFLTLRAQVLASLVAASVPLLLFETDAVWFRDPHEYFGRHSADLSLPLKGYPDKGQTLTFDPLLIRPTQASKAFFAKLAEELVEDPKLYDQDVLDALCKRQFRGSNCNTFPWDDVADGKWFKLSERTRNSISPLIVNNNYYLGVENKIARQALFGFWFLDTKGRCNQKKLNHFLGAANKK